MLNEMSSYNYFTYGNKDAYGTKSLGNTPTGTINININIKSQAIAQDGIKYTSIQYVGVTFDKNINEGWVIQYGTKKLKVLYVVRGRMHMAVMEEM